VVCKKLRDNVVRIEKNCPDCISRAHYSALRSYAAEDKQNTVAAQKLLQNAENSQTRSTYTSLSLNFALEIALFALLGE
jgi:hypothetical protein